MSRHIHQLTRLIINKNIFIAIAAAVLAYFNAHRLNYPINNWMILCIGYLVLIAYHFIRNFDPILRPNLSFHNFILIAPILIFLPFLSYFQIITLSIIVVLTLWYVQPIYKIPSLRSIPMLKIFIVGISWGSTIVLLPSNKIDTIQVLNFIEIVTLIFSLVLLFEIKDIREDFEYGLITFPSILGVSGTKYLGIILLTIAGIIHVWLRLHPLFPLVFLTAIALNLFCNANRHEFYYYILIDGLLIIWGVF